MKLGVQQINDNNEAVIPSVNFLRMIYFIASLFFGPNFLCNDLDKSASMNHD